MKTLEELQVELDAADKECEYWRNFRHNQVNNCLSDQQHTDEAWRVRNAIAAQMSKLIRAQQDACKHRWEETSFGVKYRTPGTVSYECKRCHATRFVTMKKENKHG